MTAMHVPLLTLRGLRRFRLVGASLFLLLLSLVVVERRLAEAHFNLRSWALGVESADALDGDEIRIRLVILNDDKLPSLPDVGGVLAPELRAARTPRVDRVPLGRPAPRGPPPPVPSAA